MAAVFFFLRHVFLVTSREAKRLEAIATSLVIVHVSQTLQGMALALLPKLDTALYQSYSPFFGQDWSRSVRLPPRRDSNRVSLTGSTSSAGDTSSSLPRNRGSALP